MTARRYPHLEIVHSQAGWFARLIASNGKEVWRTSEVYKRRRGAVNAVDILLAIEMIDVRDVSER